MAQNGSKSRNLLPLFFPSNSQRRVPEQQTPEGKPVKQPRAGADGQLGHVAVELWVENHGRMSNPLHREPAPLKEQPEGTGFEGSQVVGKLKTRQKALWLLEPIRVGGAKPASDRTNTRVESRIRHDHDKKSTVVHAWTKPIQCLLWFGEVFQHVQESYDVERLARSIGKVIIEHAMKDLDSVVCASVIASCF